ncbi:MAG: aldo/keto reductase [Pseudomonadota bacterium]
MNASSAPTFDALGHSGLRVSRLWLGTMTFGGRTDEAEARNIVDATRDAGLNAVDTADTYAGGESERMVGRLLHADRERWIVATKVSNPVGTEPNDRGLSRHWLMREIDNSLRRLDMDWIDVYYMHRDDEVTPVEETLGTMARLIERGKIRYYGVSNFRAWRVARMVETARRMNVPPPIVCQPTYSAVARGIEGELIPACAHYGVGVVAYSPLARGVLTGKYRPDAPPEPDSRAGRSDRRLLETEYTPQALDAAQRIAAHAQARGTNPSSFAIAWALNNRHVHGVIGGPRTLAQWRDYLDALGFEVNAQDEALIDQLVPAGHSATPHFTDPMYPVAGREARDFAARAPIPTAQAR